MVTLDELEAVVRRQLTRVVMATIRDCTIPSAVLNAATDEILTATGEYGLTEYGLARQRRSALAEATGAARSNGGVHFGTARQACGSYTTVTPPLTTDPDLVTCNRCKHTRACVAASRQRMAGAIS